MDDKPPRADMNLTESMAAKIEIEPLSDPGVEKKIADAVAALDGVSDVKIENGAVHVRYDPLCTSEKKIASAVSAAGAKVKAEESETEVPHPDLPQQLS